ncbi:hypothetical protein Ga0466249_003393 [Sporomusaceae bacterium BoRhaA]|nr:hypothetical protein [Pelorhabdus rhamnosifermentans]
MIARHWSFYICEAALGVSELPPPTALQTRSLMPHLGKEGYKAIRFFGLSLAASTDTAFCANVKYQYDGPCSWKVAVNGVDYEARFGNTQLKLNG